MFVCVFYSLNVYEPLKYQIENWIEMFGIMGLYFLTNNPLNEMFSCDRSFVFNGSNQNTFLSKTRRAQGVGRSGLICTYMIKSKVEVQALKEVRR